MNLPFQVGARIVHPGEEEDFFPFVLRVRVFELVMRAKLSPRNLIKDCNVLFVCL